ncbi:MAG: metal-sulfur cluster assembly factor [Gemmatimonadota bacterium]|nr:MAG: metal-sulfur cluster assembly factor [Gemmatimonadota bacterium]
MKEATAARQLEPVAADVWTALRDVLDPELPISIVDMGLVYDVRVSGQEVELDITFTATACPCADFIMHDIRTRLLQEPSIDAVEINIVWDPPWTNERLTQQGRDLLRVYGVSA